MGEPVSWAVLGACKWSDIGLGEESKWVPRGVMPDDIESCSMFHYTVFC